MINEEDVRQYVSVVFADPPPGSFIALRGLAEAGKTGRPLLRWVDPKGQRVPSPSLVIPIRQIVVEAVQDFVERCDEQGLAAYCLPGFVSRYGGASNEDVVGFNTVCVDFDTGIIPINISKAAEVLGKPTLIVNSGGKTSEGHAKRHVYWTVTGEGRTVARMVALRAAIASAFGGDASFARPMQIIRIAGSVHRKGEPTPVSIAYFAPENTINLAQSEVRMRAIAPPPREGVPNGVMTDNALGFARQVSLDELPMMTIGHGNTSITRFEALTRYAGSLIAQVYDIDNAEQVEREFINYAAWCRSKIENVERDYNLRQHWYRLVNREKAKRAWKRQQPRAANKYKR
jgi:hypothetical protein